MTCNRGALVLLLTALLASGCSEGSQVDPDAVVTVTGQVQAADGAPLVERPIRLATGVGVGDAALAIVTLGLACTADVCGDDVRTTTTGAQGDYRLEVLGRDTQTSFGGVRPQLLSAGAAPRGDQVSGASISAGFVVQTTAVRLPTLRLIDPMLSLGSSPSTVGASWKTTEGGPYTLTYEDEAGISVPVWEVTTAGSAATVDERVLEDTRGRAVLAGGRTDQIDGSDVRITWRSPGQGYAAAAGAPASRGRPCRSDVSDRDGACGLTDGDLASRAVLPSSCPATTPGSSPPACPPPRTAIVSLSPQEPSELIVVRGCVGTCTIEVSRDGRTFTQAGRATSAFSAIRLPQATPLAAVRVSLGDEGLREISVSGRADAAPALAPLSREAIDDVRAPFTPGGDNGRPALLIAMAAGLIALLLLALGFALGARRSRTPGIPAVATGKGPPPGREKVQRPVGPQ